MGSDKNMMILMTLVKNMMMMTMREKLQEGQLPPGAATLMGSDGVSRQEWRERDHQRITDEDLKVVEIILITVVLLA